LNSTTVIYTIYKAGSDELISATAIFNACGLQLQDFSATFNDLISFQAL